MDAIDFTFPFPCTVHRLLAVKSADREHDPLYCATSLRLCCATLWRCRLL